MYRFKQFIKDLRFYQHCAKHYDLSEKASVNHRALYFALKPFPVLFEHCGVYPKIKIIAVSRIWTYLLFVNERYLGDVITKLEQCNQPELALNTFYNLGSTLEDQLIQQTLHRFETGEALDPADIHPFLVNQLARILSTFIGDLTYDHYKDQIRFALRCRH